MRSRWKGIPRALAVSLLIPAVAACAPASTPASPGVPATQAPILAGTMPATASSTVPFSPTAAPSPVPPTRMPPTATGPVATAAPEATLLPAQPTSGQATGGGTVIDRLVDLAKQDLSRRTGAGASDVKVVETAPEEWRDSSLGCPQPGGMYAQVITPGYRVILESGGKRYEYHTDSANRVVLCQVR